MKLEEILSHCDHTLLRQECTESEIRQLCDEAIRYRCASVCIPPAHVSGCRQYAGDRMKICTVIGFPNGYSTTAVKVFEAADAVKRGADEIDMVVNLCMVRDRCYQDVADEIGAIRRATEGKILKVIIETCLLTQEEKLTLCGIVSRSGADYIKTSTGFSLAGATFEDVAFLRANCIPSVRVKAAGGISTLEDAERFLELGADRLGTSRLVKIAMQMEAASGAALQYGSKGKEIPPAAPPTQPPASAPEYTVHLDKARETVSAVSPLPDEDIAAEEHKEGNRGDGQEQPEE